MSAASLITAALLLTACNVSMAGGLLSGGLGVLIVILLIAMPVTQAGCPDDEDDNTMVDMDVGPCLTTPPLDMDIGPCLSPPPPDIDIGPCLSIAPDLGPQPDMDDADMDASDMDGGREMGRVVPSERESILDKMRERLPQDVLAALDSDDHQGRG